MLPEVVRENNMLEDVLQYFKYYPQLNAALGAGTLIFGRFLGFIAIAPILSRKDVPMLMKICFSLLVTISFVGILSPEAPPPGISLVLALFLNLAMGALIGLIASFIFTTINAAGDMINMQMGLSASMMFDPNSREQNSVMGKLFGFLATVIFIEIGGLYWLFAAFKKSFEVFPLYATNIPLAKIISSDYLILLTGNVLFIGLQMAAPVLLATLAMDVILGIISKTAPQINVFQLSFLFKPVIGAAIIILVLPTLVNTITEYFISFSHIY